MQSPYKLKITKRPPKTSNDLRRHQMTSKDENENDKPVSKKLKTNCSSRGGDSNHVNPRHCKIFIEQVF